MNQSITIYDTSGAIPGAIPASWTDRDFLTANFNANTLRSFTPQTIAQYQSDHPPDVVPCLDMEGDKRLGSTPRSPFDCWMQALQAARQSFPVGPILTFGMPTFLPPEFSGHYFGDLLQPAAVARGEQWTSAWRQHAQIAGCWSIDAGYLYSPDPVQLEPNLKLLAVELDRAGRLMPGLPKLVWCFGFYTNKEPVIPQDVADRMMLTALRHGADGFVYWDAAKRSCPMVDRLKELA